MKTNIIISLPSNLYISLTIKTINALIAVIYGLNFSFKMQFLRVFKRKKQRFFLAEPFFFAL